MDAFDRRILSELIADGAATYAALGESVGLSAPAVFERVKRLRRSGALKGVSARVDGAAVGKPLLAFVHVDVEGWGKSEKMKRLAAFPEIEEMHSVAGDTGVVMKARTRDTHALEVLLSQIYMLPGVKGTRSYVVLSTFLERPIQAETTEDWPTTPLPTE